MIHKPAFCFWMEYPFLMRRLFPVLVLVALAATACGSDNPAAGTSTAASLTTVDLVVGTGATAATGKTLTVTYGLWLYDSTMTDGKGTQINPAGTSLAPFVLGTGAVIAGWDQGLVGMKVGGQRRLTIPPSLAYGGTSPGNGIPANASLVFDVNLLNVQ
jgi:FKBP-type peptidyl-prolyl cis-trans isomerase